MLKERTDIAAARSPIDPRAVVGWGVDADPDNDPTYPYRDRSADEGLTRNWKRPLHSIEHVRTPAVFGTAVPPRGLSGMIRRAAFRWSESNWVHWLMLMGADRLNVVEGVVEDLARARIPNIPAEMGIRSEWKHNKTGLAKKVAVTAGVGLALYFLFRGSREDETDPAAAV
jgi:hypothetical protein